MQYQSRIIIEQLFMSSVATSDGQTFLLFDDIRLDRLYHPVCDLINSKSHQKLGWNKVTWRFQFLNRFIMRTHGFLTINLSHRKTCRSVICIFSTSFWGNLYIRPKTGQNGYFLNVPNFLDPNSHIESKPYCSYIWKNTRIVKTFDKLRSRCLARVKTAFLHRYI